MSVIYGLVGELFAILTDAVLWRLDFRFHAKDETGEYVTYFDRSFPYFAEFTTLILVASVLLVILNALHKLWKNLYGPIGDVEDTPGEILGRMAITLPCTVLIYSFLNVGFYAVNTIYQSMVSLVNLDENADFKMSSVLDMLDFSDILATDLDGAAASAGQSLLGLVVVTVCLFAIFIQFLNLILEFIQRYCLSAILYYFSPLAMAVNGSRTSAKITKTYFMMLLSQFVLMMVDIIFIYAIIMAMTSGKAVLKTPFDMILWTFMIFSLIKIALRLDNYLSQLGLTSGLIPSSVPDFFAGAFAMRSAKNTVKDVAKTGAKAGSAVFHAANKASGGMLAERMKNFGQDIGIAASGVSFQDAAMKTTFRDGVTARGMNKESVMDWMQQASGDASIGVSSDGQSRTGEQTSDVDLNHFAATRDIAQMNEEQKKGFVMNSLQNTFGDQISGIDPADITGADIGRGGFGIDLLEQSSGSVTTIRGRFGDASEAVPHAPITEGDGQCFGASNIGNGMYMSAQGSAQSVAKALGAERLQSALEQQYGKGNVTPVSGAPGVFQCTDNTTGAQTQYGLSGMYEVGTSNGSYTSIKAGNTTMDVVKSSIPTRATYNPERNYASTASTVSGFQQSFPDFHTADLGADGYHTCAQATYSNGRWDVVMANGSNSSAPGYAERSFSVCDSNLYAPKSRDTAAVSMRSSTGYMHFAVETTDALKSASGSDYADKMPIKRIDAADNHFRKRNFTGPRNRNEDILHRATKASEKQT